MKVLIKVGFKEHINMGFVTTAKKIALGELKLFTFIYKVIDVF